MGQNECCQAQNQIGDLKLKHPIFLNKDPEDAVLTNEDISSSNSKNLSSPDDYRTMRKVSRPPLTQAVEETRAQLNELSMPTMSEANRGSPDPNFYQFPLTGKTYQGEWKNKKPHGLGTMFFPNGSMFEGTYVDGIPYGHGRLILSAGDYYEGEVKYGRANGYGCYYKGDFSYKGGFLDDNKHGVGEQQSSMYYFKGLFSYGEKVEGILKYGFEGKHIYEGQFEEDLFHGRGVLTCEDGVYKGSFRYGEQSGYGQFLWNDDSIYRGNYYKGERQGDGQFYNGRDSTISKGFWEKGSLHGQGQYVEAIGRVHKVIWDDGKISAIISTQ